MKHELHFWSHKLFFVSSNVLVMLIWCLCVCLFGIVIALCYIFRYQFLESRFFFTLLSHYSSCCYSIVVPFVLSLLALLLLTHYRSSCIATPPTLLLFVLLFSHYNCVLVFSRHNSFPDATPLVLLLLLHCFSHPAILLTLLLPLRYTTHVAIPFALFFSHHHTFQVHANLASIVLFMLSLLLLLRCYFVLFG